MAQVKLVSGEIAYVDDCDLHLVEGVSWRIHRNNGQSYAAHWETLNGKKVVTLMHRLITGASTEDVDHHDGDGLNNRRSNLRPCTHTQNMQNRKRHKNNRSGFKGVYWNASKGKWIAQIQAFGKKSTIGRFDDPETAARAYNEAASALHGEFARLNAQVA